METCRALLDMEMISTLVIRTINDDYFDHEFICCTVTSSDDLLCLTNNPKHKNIHSFIMWEQQKQQILTFENLEMV